MSTLRVVSYAINGRGLGHLTRQLAILRQIRQIAALLDLRLEAWVITSSEADTLARREGIPALKMPSKAMFRDAGIDPTRYLAVARGWVLNCVAGLGPDLLLVDTFPAGSFGELVSVLELAQRRVLVQRRVRDAFAEEASYAALLPLFHDTIVPDDRGTGPILLRSRHEMVDREAARAALGVPAEGRAVYVSVGGGGDKAAGSTLPRLVRSLTGRGWHVVVGAGPLYFGPEVRGDGITWLSRYAPVELFAGLDAAVSAAGQAAIIHDLQKIKSELAYLQFLQCQSLQGSLTREQAQEFTANSAKARQLQQKQEAMQSARNAKLSERGASAGPRYAPTSVFAHLFSRCCVAPCALRASQHR